MGGIIYLANSPESPVVARSVAAAASFHAGMEGVIVMDGADTFGEGGGGFHHLRQLNTCWDDEEPADANVQ